MSFAPEYFARCWGETQTTDAIQEELARLNAITDYSGSPVGNAMYTYRRIWELETILRERNKARQNMPG